MRVICYFFFLSAFFFKVVNSNLSHPHLVQIFGVVRNPGSCVAEFIDGGTLDSYLEDEVSLYVVVFFFFLPFLSLTFPSGQRIIMGSSIPTG